MGPTLTPVLLKKEEEKEMEGKEEGVPK